MSDYDDLYGAFTLLEERAPITCDVPPRAQDARRRLRRLMPLAAVAAVAAVAVTVALVIRYTGSESPTRTAPAAASTPPTQPLDNLGDSGTLSRPAPGQPVRLTTNFIVAPVAGYTVTPVETNRVYQHGSIRVDALEANHNQNVAGGGDLYVFYENGYVPREAKQGQSITVNGHPGYLGQAYRPMPQGGYDGTAVDTLAWQYVPGGWAMVTMDDAAVFQAAHTSERTELLKLARAVQGSTGAPLAVPFSMTYLPADLYPDGAQSSTGKPLLGQIGLGDGAPGSTADKYHIGSALTVTVSEGFPVCGPSNAGTSATPFAGGAGCVYEVDGKVSGVGVGADGHELAVSVDVNHFGRYSAATLRKILDHITLAPNPDDPGTWFDATTAVPR